MSIRRTAITTKAVVESLISRISNFHLSLEAQREENAKLIFNLCSELKGCGTKLVQLLALEEDLLPKSVLADFNKSFNKVEPLSRIKTLKAIDQYLGKSHRELFQSIEYPPTHAGSIGQVHNAVLLSGEEVVVKVQYPFVQSDMEFDFKLLRKVAKASSQKLISRTIDEVVDSIILEVDYLREAESMELFHKVAPSLDIACPRPFKDLCTSKLLIQDKIQGTPLSLVNKEDVSKECLQEIFDFFFSSLLEHRLLYADPHPGNFLISEKNLGVVDFGLVKTDLSDNTISLLRTFFSQELDFSEITKLYNNLGAKIEIKDADDFQKGFCEYHEALHKVIGGEETSFVGKFKEIRALRNVLLSQANKSYFQSLDTEFTMIHKSMHALFFMMARFDAVVELTSLRRD